MPYSVREPADQVQPGDLVTATLVVDPGGDAYLTNLKKTGHADLPAGAGPVKIMDLMKPGEEVPDDPLLDQAGATRRLSDWRGQALAVTFVYTRCPLPDFCPMLDRRFGELQRAIAGTRGCGIGFTWSRSASIRRTIRPRSSSPMPRPGGRPAHVELPHGNAGRHRPFHVAIRRLHDRGQGHRRDPHPQPAHRRDRSQGPAAQDPLGQRMDRRDAARRSA